MADAQEYLMSFAPIVAPVGAALAWLLVDIVKRASLRWRLYDHPNERSSHSVPTPRLGGIGLAFVLIGGLALGTSLHVGAASRGLWILAGMGAVVSCVSLVDDLRPLPPLVRLGVHIAAAAVVLGAAGPLPTLDTGGAIVPLAPWLGSVLLVVWVAGFINAFNFMDGIDGIAAGQALVAGAGWVVLGTLDNAPSLTYAGWLVVGVSGGFLAHNWAPATIFMGDAGSALLGFVLAAAPILLAGPHLLVPAALLVWPFVFDTAFTLVRRARRGEPVWQPHRSHLYQRLARPGVSHRSVAWLYIALATVGAVSAVILVSYRNWSPAALASVVLAALALWRHVEQRERRAAVAITSS